MVGYYEDKIEIKKNKVLKLSDNPDRIKFLHNQYEWLCSVKKLLPFNIPSGLSKLDNGYNMKHYTDLKSINASDFEDIISYINIIKTKNNTIPMFQTYLSYIDSVVEQQGMFMPRWINIRKELELFDEFANNERSFCHGDLTVNNILCKENAIFLINPNFKESMWQSYYLDFAKLFQELHIKEPFLFNVLVNKLIEKNNLKIKSLIFIHLLELTHYIRMFPYLKNYSDNFYERVSEFEIKEIYTFNLINSLII